MQYLTYSTLAAKSSRLREGSGGGNYKGSALSPKTARTYNEAGSSSKGIDAGISHEVLRHAVFPTYLVDWAGLPGLWVFNRALVMYVHIQPFPASYPFSAVAEEAVSRKPPGAHQAVPSNPKTTCPFLAVAVEANLGSQSSSPIKIIPHLQLASIFLSLSTFPCSGCQGCPGITKLKPHQAHPQTDMNLPFFAHVSLQWLSRLSGTGLPGLTKPKPPQDPPVHEEKLDSF
eukprot:scaffold91925_cov23-Tisochrysis_lutea.AAC.3